MKRRFIKRHQKRLGEKMRTMCRRIYSGVWRNGRPRRRGAQIEYVLQTYPELTVHAPWFNFVPNGPCIIGKVTL